MKLLVTSPGRFELDSQDQFWTDNASLSYDFWTRYLDVFDEVVVCARARPMMISSNLVKVTGPGVRAAPIPYFLGPEQYMLRANQVRRAIQGHVRKTQAVIVRLSCTIGEITRRSLASEQPFGVEVVSDPFDVFAPGSVRHPLRAFFRWLYSRNLRKACAGAPALSYVTEQALQKRYPPNAHAFCTSFSSIVLPEAAFSIEVPTIDVSNRLIRLITVATLAQLYKGPHVLIDAVGLCVRDGLNLGLTLVGDGKFRAELQQRAGRIGLSDRAEFLGQISRADELRRVLDGADLFVLPSYQEGLPRAMIEAMARGLPCIGSTVGGIPELLPPDDLVEPGNPCALAEKIREVVSNPHRMFRMAQHNLSTARRYHEENLRQKRILFYKHVRDQTLRWLEHSRPEGR